MGGGFAKLAYHDGGAPTGFDVRFGGGFDYYVSNAFSVGGKLDVDLLRLSYDAIINASRVTVIEGWSSLGLVVTPAAVAGLHF